MAERLKLMCILAHPDDESLGTGGILARYADEGIETYVITATRGQRGWTGAAEDYPGPEALGQIREAELYAAARVLGVREVTLLDYMDGELDRADPSKVIADLVFELRRVRPQVVVTFDPFGAYGHPDHIAISQHTSAAIVAAADSHYLSRGGAAHRVAKLYYFVETTETVALYHKLIGELAMVIDSVKRQATAWPDWAITTRIDTVAYWRQVWRAALCHRSQLPGFTELQGLSDEIHKVLWGKPALYRAFSLVNGGREVETDVFEGVRRQPLAMESLDEHHLSARRNRG